MATDWYYSHHGQRVGPISSAQLRHAAEREDLLPIDQVWKIGMTKWVSAKSVKGLFPADEPMRINVADEAPSDSDSPWFYIKDSKRLGPVSGADISTLLDKGTIDSQTFVWKTGFTDWTPIAQTALKRTESGPPPLIGAAINNGFAWTVAFVPIIGGILENIIVEANHHANTSSLWMITWALNVGLCFFDEKHLKQAGYDTSSFGKWSLWIVPVYLYRRAMALRQSLAYFITWIVCFFVSLLL